MDQKARPEPLSPLSMHILLALAAEDLHGYALMGAIREQSAGAVRPGTGSLYAAVQRLVDEGRITVVEDGEGGAGKRGRTYRLTPEGRSAARAEAARLRDLVDLASSRRIAPTPEEAG